MIRTMLINLRKHHNVAIRALRRTPSEFFDLYGEPRFGAKGK